MEKEKTQMTKIRNEIGNKMTPFLSIKRIVIEQYASSYAKKLGKLDKMDTFLEIHNLLRQDH